MGEHPFRLAMKPKHLFNSPLTAATTFVLSNFWHLRSYQNMLPLNRFHKLKNDSVLAAFKLVCVQQHMQWYP